ncbi:MAG: hypothetical protein KatS3mg110_4387 [Pirellulaceae bacterium]|nr:MAG: hypothetical protein KatS3mg110_4387 [Pirellulaceae bacterium]
MWRWTAIGAAAGWLLLVSLLGAAEPTASGLSWRSLEEAWRLAQAQQKPMLVYISLSGCSYCRMMDQYTLAEPQLRRELEERFVLARLDGEKHAGWVERWSIKSYPTLVIISPDNRMMSRMSGFMKSEELWKQLSACCIDRVGERTRENKLQ